MGSAPARPPRGRGRRRRWFVTAGLAYLAFGLAWIFLGDRWLAASGLPAEQVQLIELWKGILFVVVSALLIVGLLQRLWRQRDQLDELHIQQLQDERDRLQQRFFELPFVGMALTSPESKRWLDFNDRLCEILGYSREELLRVSWAEITHPEDVAADVAEFERVLRGEADGYRMEKRFVRKDGEVVHAFIDVRAQRRSDGSIEVFYATVDDISAEVRARDALRDSEQRWRRVVAEAPYPMMVHDDTGRILALSRGWCNASGYRCEQLGSIEHWIELAHPPQRRASVRSAIAGLFAVDARVDQGEHPIGAADGSERIWLFSSSPLGRDADGHRLRVSMASDMTEPHRLLGVLRQSVGLYRQMFDANPIAMYVFAADDLRILEVNDAALQRYGWSRDEMLGMTIERLRPASELRALRESLARLDPKRANTPGLFTHQRRDGSTLRVEISVHAIEVGGRPAWLAMANDVSERERAQAERDDYVRRLERATASTLEVVSTMVELRDPYTAGHERRVGEIAAAIAGEMQLSGAVQQGLRMCGAVHDVGKIAVPAEILAKPTRLTAAEYQVVQQHAALGYDILKSIDLPWPLAEVARQHHERIDGSGYPRGLKGDDILLEARIVAVADVVESMASHRPYRPAIGPALALAEIEAGRGSRYDPAVVDACLRLFREQGYQLPV